MDSARQQIHLGKLKFVYPSTQYREQILDFKRKFTETGETILGSEYLYKYNVNKWLERVTAINNGAILKDFVPATVYLAIRKSDNKLVGIISFRHCLNEELAQVGGHIGNSVAPDERNKGYGAEILCFGCKKAKEIGLDRVLITCKSTNIASEKQIIKVGGILENEIEINGTKSKRFWVELD
jgi:predicted acetyltransferase